MIAIADRAGCAPVPLTARVRGYSNRALPRSGDAERSEWIAMADAALLARSCRSGISELMQECGAALHTHQPHEAQGGPPRSFCRSRVHHDTSEERFRLLIWSGWCRDCIGSSVPTSFGGNPGLPHAGSPLRVGRAEATPIAGQRGGPSSSLHRTDARKRRHEATGPSAVGPFGWPELIHLRRPLLSHTADGEESHSPQLGD
ncbi:hypothetical protein L1887_57178 [Cichorium endivia]|nr:hypothetical protein L1887_57178 [Cichorium endivia]